MHGVSRPHGAEPNLAMTILSVLPSASPDSVGAPVRGFRGSIPSLHVPLSTLHATPYDASRMNKIVQQAVVEVLHQIYEEDFLGFSYGFRPGRGAHDALDSLTAGMMTKKVNWILDADIKGFFDNIDHEKLMELIELRIAVPRILRLIGKWLTAGVSEDGHWSKTKVGTPQGAVISPLLANIYLHYALDQWVMEWRKVHADGDMIIVRYADDFVLGFQHRGEAESFLKQLRERMAQYGLELHSEKTRLMEFGRFAAGNRKRVGAGETGDVPLPGIHAYLQHDP